MMLSSARLRRALEIAVVATMVARTAVQLVPRRGTAVQLVCCLTMAAQIDSGCTFEASSMAIYKART